ncbi:hypothetical protein PCASD_22911 [Puccinia coronata f. sp. avenae]|uniref:Uncharacterized protein n=1 Tax=Puccinia coronata f. sp. avenae TaxID=200324 RepID=A0A2N5RZJ6_9BASI|nr:hypothetical protein PCASD_22911 [Puccinia coronata f. sp. avenae]
MSSGKMPIGQVSIEDDMEEDFDDLLSKFGAPSDAEPKNEQRGRGEEVGVKASDTSRSNISNSRAQASSSSSSSEGTTTDGVNAEISDDFARDLAEGMEALLAGMNQEDGGEFKKHLEALVSASADGGGLNGASDLLDALNQHGPPDSALPSSSSAPPPLSTKGFPEPDGAAGTKNFQAAIQETMEKLKQSDDSAKAKSGASAVGEEDEKLSALFEKMMAGENGLPDENQLQTILQSFMEELMSKEIMYEPLKDMNRLFPDWIQENRSKLSAEELQRYETQSKIIEQVIRKFEDPSWDSDEKAGGDKFVTNQKEVIDLLTQMQDCGPPPKEILGDMPAGVFGEDGLPNPEQCLIS